MDCFEPIHRNVQAQGGVLIYIDNSNIWINTMHYSAKKLKFINDIQQDQRVRVNIHQMVTTAAAQRPIIRCVLYGSEPPPVKTFWNNVKDLNVDVQVTKKSTYSNREREVDQNISVDIGEEIVIHREHANYNGTIILFTGDGGMASAVEKAVSKYHWNVEIWSYSHSLAKIYSDRFKEQPKVQICLLDSYFDKFAYYTHEWRDLIPPERSFVLTFQKLHKNDRSEVLKKFVEAVTKLVKLPMSARFIHEGKLATAAVGPAHLALVCNVSAQILKEDSRYDQLLKNSNDVNRPQVLFHLSKDDWNRFVELVYGDQELHLDLPNAMKGGLEKLFTEILNRNSLGEIKFTPKYDFNKDVFHKTETVLGSPNHCGDEQVEELKQIVKKHHPRIRSMPQFLQDMRLDHIPETRFEAPSKEDGGEEGFQVVNYKKPQKKKFQKYSEQCKHGFRCRKGFQCTFSHTNQQLEFFKVQPDSAIRSTYKHKDCDHFNGLKGGVSGCKYKGPVSYMCPYAHGTFCLKCQKDDDGGHNHVKCPETVSMMRKWIPTSTSAPSRLEEKAAVNGAHGGMPPPYEMGRYVDIRKVNVHPTWGPPFQGNDANNGHNGLHFFSSPSRANFPPPGFN